MNKHLWHSITLVLMMSGISGTVHAHSVFDLNAGFVGGFSHPLTGLDHLLVMFGTGIWIACGRRAKPIAMFAAIVLAVSSGALFRYAGFTLSHVEELMTVSVLVTGLLLLKHIRREYIPATVLLLIGFCQGYVHAYEWTQSGTMFNYSLGFILSSALLTGSGVMIAGIAETVQQPLVRLYGWLCAGLGGWWLLTI